MATQWFNCVSGDVVEGLKLSVYIFYLNFLVEIQNNQLFVHFNISRHVIWGIRSIQLLFSMDIILNNNKWMYTFVFPQDETLLSNNTFPEFTDCFQNTILVWIPCGFLWITAPCYLYALLSYKGSPRQHSFLNIAKTVSIN